METASKALPISRFAPLAASTAMKMQTLQSEIYCRAMAKFPECVVRDVIHSWDTFERGDWFPTLKELNTQLREATERFNKIGEALKDWGTPEADPKFRIRMIKYDILDAERRQTPPRAAEVPDYMRGLQGKPLDDMIPRYRKDMLARIETLEALL